MGRLDCFTAKSRYSTMKENVDLVSVVQSAGVELKRSGSRYVGLCPFHADETPSFFVFPDGHFKCFGCGEHGDVIDFIQKIHGCTFKEALSIVGIEQGELTPKKREEIKKLQHQRKLIKAFRRWEIEATDQVTTFLRAARLLVGEIRDSETLEKYGHLYHQIPQLEYHLDVLISNDEQAKLGLFEAAYHG